MRMSEVQSARTPSRLGTPAHLSCWLCCLLVGAAVFGCNKAPKEGVWVPVRVIVLTPEEVVVSSRFNGSVEPFTLDKALAGVWAVGEPLSYTQPPPVSRNEGDCNESE
jgi:hypothetical protein